MLTDLQIASQVVMEKSQLFVSKGLLRRRKDGRDG
jgi:hypothetical protein